jgi:hypothetical protein
MFNNISFHNHRRQTAETNAHTIFLRQMFLKALLKIQSLGEYCQSPRYSYYLSWNLLSYVFRMTYKNSHRQTAVEKRESKHVLH